MLIIKKYDEELVSLVATRCGDPEFNDFVKKIYGQAIVEAMNSIAKEFSVVVKRASYTIEENDPTWVVLPASEIKGIARLRVNGIEYQHKNSAQIENSYDYRYDADRKWRFTYYGISSGQEVEIEYSTVGEVASTQDGTPILPIKFAEAIITAATRNVAKLGIAKFSDPVTKNDAKKMKYIDILRMYATPKYEGALERNDAWIEIKPYIYP